MKSRVQLDSHNRKDEVSQGF